MSVGSVIGAIGLTFVGLVGGLLFLGGMMAEKAPPPKPIEKPAAGAEITDEYFKEVEHAAWRDCMREIENRARYDFKWTSKWSGGGKFWYPTGSNKYQREDGVVALTGDDVEFKNGFGAWLPQTYTCKFDPEKKEVVEVIVTAGKLERTQ
jgi:hypothetical protein